MDVGSFSSNGFVVIENVLNEDEVSFCRESLHQEILKYGVVHEDLFKSSNNLRPRKKSDVSNIFYSKWKLELQLRSDIYALFREANIALECEYAPLGKSTDVLPYIDRIGYRLPDIVQKEGGLSLHIDRRPPLDGDDSSCFTCIKKYRPIQGFISLTDQYGSDSGGLKVVRGFHREFEAYFASSTADVAESGGEFYRMHGKQHTKLQQRLEPVSAPAGSLVLWDNRLPHATCENLAGCDTREVVYMSYIPNIPINVQYVAQQRDNLIANIAPPAYVKENSNLTADRDYNIDSLTVEQRRLLGFVI